MSAPIESRPSALARADLPMTPKPDAWEAVSRRGVRRLATPLACRAYGSPHRSSLAEEEPRNASSPDTCNNDEHDREVGKKKPAVAGSTANPPDRIRDYQHDVRDGPPSMAASFLSCPTTR
jgi:hypothetical protein